MGIFLSGDTSSGNCMNTCCQHWLESTWGVGSGKWKVESAKMGCGEVLGAKPRRGGMLVARGASLWMER